MQRLFFVIGRDCALERRNIFDLAGFYGHVSNLDCTQRFPSDAKPFRDQRFRSNSASFEALNSQFNGSDSFRV